MRKIRVMLVDGQPLVAAVLALRLAAEEDMEVVSTKTGPEYSITAARLLRPAVVVIVAAASHDLGTELARALRSAVPGVNIVIIGGEDDPVAVCSCLAAGASAWLSQYAPASSLPEAIRASVAGEIHIPAHLLTPVIRHLQDGRTVQDENWARIARLSDRERSTLEFMVSGLDRETIARRLGVSLNTVRTHTQHCYAKLGVHSSLEAVHLAFRAGLRPGLSVVASAGGPTSARGPVPRRPDPGSDTAVVADKVRRLTLAAKGG